MQRMSHENEVNTLGFMHPVKHPPPPFQRRAQRPKESESLCSRYLQFVMFMLQQHYFSYFMDKQAEAQRN